MVSEGYIYVLVRNDGRHMYFQSASLDMSPVVLAINDVVKNMITTLMITTTTGDISRLADWQYICLPSLQTST